MSEPRTNPELLAKAERLKPDDLIALQQEALQRLLSEILRSNPFYQKRFAESGATARTPLRDLPFTHRSDFERDQMENPPYGTILTYPKSRYLRSHQTSASTGVPLRWLDTAESWAWFKSCWQTVFRAAGVASVDRVLFTFSFGPFFGFWGAFESAFDLGCFVLPCGGMTTLARLQYLKDHSATVICCTPTYAMRMAEVARENGIELANSSVRSLIVAGEPGGSIPSTRQRIESSWGARVFDHAGMTEMGAYGFECRESPGGFHFNEAEFITEVVRPGSVTACGEGESGELVLTNLGRLGSPAIRYRTGDLVRLVRGRCACGRWFARAEGGILGRIDDMLLVRGNNVHPAAIENVLREFAEIAEFRLSVTQRAGMEELQLEIEPIAGAKANDLSARVTDAMRDRFHFRPIVLIADPGSLPRFEMKARRILKQARNG